MMNATYHKCILVLYSLIQIWYCLAVSLEEKLVPRRKSHSHALLKEQLFSGEMKNLERRPCTTRVPPPQGSLLQKLSAMTEARTA